MSARHLFMPTLRAAITLAFALATSAASVHAATLVPGDLVVLNSPQWDASHSILRVDAATGLPIETISSGGLLVDPSGILVTPFGAILVADPTVGIVKVDPATGVQTIFTPLAAFGGSGPRGIAREANGDFVVVCGDANGIWRLSPAGAVLSVFSAHANIIAANAITVAPNGTLWVADGAGRVVAVDPALGTQTVLNVTGVEFHTPFGIAIGKSGSPLYVCMLGVFSYHEVGRAYQIDPVSGVGAVIPTAFLWSEGAAVDPVTGNAYVTSIDVINHDTPYFGRISKSVAGTWATLSPDFQKLSGILAVVPPQLAAPATPTTWGRVKAMMR
jgi:DNA-binding beta-propeller fold protein YncE